MPFWKWLLEFLKQGEILGKTYGMPYKGSKNAIAEKIIDVLPQADCLVNLFGGGGAITDCALQSGKYKKAIYNELEPLIYKGFKTAVNGEFKNETRWISREDFFKLKDTDPYAAMCFSFGNDLKTYAYSRELEPIKERMHYIFFAKTPKEARLHFKQFLRLFKKSGMWVNRLQRFQNLRSLENLERLERLQSLRSLEELENLERLERLEMYNLSYEQVQIPDNSIIYCDIPYKTTTKYLCDFDYDKFYNWALSAKMPIYISEYQMPEPFTEIARFDKMCNLSCQNGQHTVEKLFYNNKKAW